MKRTIFPALAAVVIAAQGADAEQQFPGKNLILKPETVVSGVPLTLLCETRQSHPTITSSVTVDGPLTLEGPKGKTRFLVTQTLPRIKPGVPGDESYLTITKSGTRCIVRAYV